MEIILLALIGGMSSFLCWGKLLLDKLHFTYTNQIISLVQINTCMTWIMIDIWILKYARYAKHAIVFGIEFIFLVK